MFTKTAWIPIICAVVTLLSIAAMVSFSSELTEDIGDGINMISSASSSNYQVGSKLNSQNPLTGAISHSNTMNVHAIGPGGGFIPQRRLESWSSVETRNSTSSTSCTICGNLGVPLLDNFIPDYNMTCSKFEDDYYKTVPEDECIVESKWEIACCDQSGLLAPYQCEEAIQEDILERYNTIVAPLDVNTRRVDVGTFITHYYLRNVDITTSSLEIIVKIYQTWKDPRLAWNVTDDRCVTSTDMRASHDKEKTDIWVPPFDLINKRKGVQDFPDSIATVYFDGTVVWERAGYLVPQCTFVGLEKMPFDVLGCQLIFGGGRLGAINYILLELKIDEETFKGFLVAEDYQPYHDFKIVPELASFNSYSDGLMNSLGASFHLDLFFERSHRHYAMFVIFPDILFVTMSFGQFLLDIDSGERLSFGVTIVLIMVTQSVVVSSLLPLCQESLWINIFNFYSMIFTILPLLVTLVGFFLIRKQNLTIHDRIKGENNNSGADRSDEEDREFLIRKENNSNDAGKSDEEVRESGEKPNEVLEESGNDDEIEFETKNESIELNGDKSKNERQHLETKPSRMGLSKQTLAQSIRVIQSKIPRTPIQITYAIDRTFFILLPSAYFLFITIQFILISKGKDPNIGEDGKYIPWSY